MSPKILVLGTSNALLKNGWTAGLRQALPEATIDDRSIGGAPSFQFGWVLDTDFAQFDVVLFDTVCNDEKATEELSAGYLDRLAYEIIATIAAQTKVIVLGIPMDRHFLVPSAIYEQRRRIAELCGAQFVGFREVMRRFGRAVVGPTEALFETQSHPAQSIAALVGETLGRQLPAMLADWPAPRPETQDFRDHFGHADPVEASHHGRVVELSNSLLSARLLELTPGQTVTFSETRPCVGFCINVDGTRAAIELGSPAGRMNVEHWFDLVDDRIELRFMPLPQPFDLSELQVTPKWRGGKARKPRYEHLSYDEPSPRLQLGRLVFWSGDAQAVVPEPANEPGDSLLLHRRVEAALAAALPAGEPSDESAVPVEEFLRLRRFDFAAERLEQQAASTPDDPRPLDRAAQAWLHYGDLDRAVDCLARSADIAAAPETLEQLGCTLVRLDRKAEAVAAYTRRMALEPTPTLALELGRLMLQAGDHAAAQPHLELAAAAEVAPEAHLLLGRALAGLKQYESAAAAFARFLAVQPRHFTALYQLGKALVAQRRFTEAIGNLVAAAEIEPDNAAVTRELARAHTGLGDHLKAMQLLQPLVEGDAVDWSCLITYGRAATALKLGDAAVRALRRAAELRPDDPATIKALEQAMTLAS